MILTISRQRGSGGDEIAARVAQALNLALIDREDIRQAARTAGVPDEVLHRLMYEGERSLAAKILQSLGGTGETIPLPAPQLPLGGIFAPPLPPASIDLEEGVRTIGRLIRELAERGDALILGQGSQVLLRDRPDACHIQIVAPLEWRVARLVAQERLSPTAARRTVRASDLARADYLARYHNVNWLDPTLYHLVINTGKMTIEMAVALIVQWIRQWQAGRENA